MPPTSSESPSKASNPPPADKSLLDAAVDLARAAGDVSLEWFKPSGVEAERKSDGSPVTAADKAAEDLVRKRISELTPDASIVGEEHGTVQGTSDITWYVDPIDGTAGFARGVPLYSTLIAVTDAHGPVIGVIHIPATDETVWAGRGLGAFTTYGAVRVSATQELRGACVTTSGVHRWSREVFTRMQEAGVEIKGWGDGYGFLMAASGRLEAMIDLNGGSAWDYAPLPVIMREAGGRFSALDGTESFDAKNAVASNGVLHERLLGLIRGPDSES